MTSHDDEVEPDVEMLASRQIDAVDERAISLIRDHLAATDPVPGDLAGRVKFAMTVASLEAEVAHLTSAPLEHGVVRTADYDRASTVTFESAGLSIMVSIEDDNGSAAILRGWVTAPGARVELRERARTSTTTADNEGRFAFPDVGRGTVHLLIHPDHQPGTRPVITPGIEI